MAATSSGGAPSANPLPEWTTREQLILASAVQRSGDQNWVSVSRAVKPLIEEVRTPDFFSQKNCALQYSAMLDKAATPKRKRSIDGTAEHIETVEQQIVKGLSEKRIAELDSSLSQTKAEYLALKAEIEQLEQGKLDNKLPQLWEEIQTELASKDKEDVEGKNRVASMVLKSPPPSSSLAKMPEQLKLRQPKPPAPSDPPPTTRVSDPRRPEPHGLKPSLSSLSLMVEKRRQLVAEATKISSPSSSEVEHPLARWEGVGLDRQRSLSSDSVALSDDAPRLTVPREEQFLRATQPSPADPLKRLSAEALDIVQQPNTALAELGSRLGGATTPTGRLSQPTTPTSARSNMSGPIRVSAQIELVYPGRSDSDGTRPSGTAPLHPSVARQQGTPMQIDSPTPKHVSPKASTPFPNMEIALRPSLTGEARLSQSYTAMPPTATPPSLPPPPPLPTTTADGTSSPREHQATPHLICEDAVAPPPPPRQTGERRREGDSQVAKGVEGGRVAKGEEEVALGGGKKEAVSRVGADREVEEAATGTRPAVSRTPEKDRGIVVPRPVPELHPPSPRIQGDVLASPPAMVAGKQPSLRHPSTPTSPPAGAGVMREKRRETTGGKKMGVQQEMEQEHAPSPPPSLPPTLTPAITPSSTPTTSPPPSSSERGRGEGGAGRGEGEEEEDDDEEEMPIQLRRRTRSSLRKHWVTRSRKRRFDALEEGHSLDSTDLESEDDGTSSQLSAAPSPAPSQSDLDPEVVQSQRQWRKAIMLVWQSTAQHKYANLFLHPVKPDDAPGYRDVILQPMDLYTIKKKIETGVIRTHIEFQRDILLMFQNAFMYNSSDHAVYGMAESMRADVMEGIQDYIATQLMVESSTPKILRSRDPRSRLDLQHEEPVSSPAKRRRT